MSAPSVIVEYARHTVFFAGNMHAIHEAVRIVGARKQYEPRRRAVAVPRAAADDVMTALEMRFGVDVQVVEAIA